MRSPTPYREGYSKNLFACPLCARMVRAHELVNDINGVQVRDARLFCERCGKRFEAMPPRERAELLRGRFEEHYGERQFIYALNDPHSGTRRYVGRASDPQRRLTQHIQKAKQWNPERTREFIAEVRARFPDRVLKWEEQPSSKKWIISLLESGEKPVLEVLEAVTPPVRVSEREMRWICQSIKEGHDLLNAENSSEALRTVIRQERVDSFLTADFDKLIRSKLPGKIEYLLGGRDTGWRRAILIHTLYKPRPILTTIYVSPTWSRLSDKVRKRLRSYQ
jgi:hypothetical protein